MMRPHQPQKIFSEGKYALILLNTNLRLNHSFFSKIWNKALIRHTVDGGSNQFYDFYKTTKNCQKTSNTKLPELASGDFDSINQCVMDFLIKRNQTKIVRTEDQNKTDFMKALEVLKDFIQERQFQIDSVIAIVESSSRLDHTFANFNTLHKSPFLKIQQVNHKDINTHQVHLYLLSSENLTWLLPADIRTSIKLQPPLGIVCGVVPLMGPTQISSEGLKWELNDEVYSIDGVISTSNQMIKDEIKLEPREKPVLFTMELKTNDYVL